MRNECNTSVNFESRGVEESSVQQGLEADFVEGVSGLVHRCGHGGLESAMNGTIRFCDTEMESPIDQSHEVFDRRPRESPLIYTCYARWGEAFPASSGHSHSG